MAHQAAQSPEQSHIPDSKSAHVVANNIDRDSKLEHYQPLHHHDQLRATSTKKSYPLSLQPIALILFTTALLSILAALISIWLYAIKHQGFTILSDNHYTWTYGPTAIFVIITSYWRLIDYHLKALTPWQELQKGPVDADRSILLDHVSSFLLTTIFSAAKKRHLWVCTTITGFFVLKIVTIASTGLFSRTSIVVGPLDVNMTQTSQFYTLSNFTSLSDPGASPFYNAYAVMEQGLPIPEGLTTTLLYETYKPASEHTNPGATYSVRSRALAPLVTCNMVDILPIPEKKQVGVGNPVAPLRVQNTPGWACPSPDTPTYKGGLGLSLIDISSQVAPPRQILATFARFRCDPLDAAKNPWPFFIAVSDVRYSQTYNTSMVGTVVGEHKDPVSWAYSVPQITGMLCSINYEMKDVRVLYNSSLSGNSVQKVDILRTSDPVRMENVTVDYLARMLWYADSGPLEGATDMFGSDIQYQYVEQPPETVLTMIAKHVKADYAYLLGHPEEFAAAAQYVLNTMLLYVAKENIVIPDTNSTFRAVNSIAQEYYTEERLEISLASFIVMVVGISISILMTIAVLLCRPGASILPQPEAISSAAKILAAGNTMHEILERLALTTEKPATRVLKQTRYQMEINDRGRAIVPQSMYTDIPQSNNAENGTFKAYLPLTLSKVCLVLTLLSAPATVAILEVLQHLSDSGFPGISTLSDVDSVKALLYSRFLPAIVALLIATMFNSLDFNTVTLAPYGKMLVGPGSYEDLGVPILARIPPVILFIAFRRRYWAALLTGIAALVGSLLTIIVSGLLTIEQIPNSVNISLFPSDSWNMSYVSPSGTDNAATAVSSLIESANLSYPQLTYEELAFPSLNIDYQSQGFEDYNGLLSVNVPALRAELDCEEVPWSFSNATIRYDSLSAGAGTNPFNVRLSVKIPLPENCQYGSCHGNESTISVSGLAAFLSLSSNTTYWAQAIDIHTGPYHPEEPLCSSFESSGTVPPENSDQPLNQPGCPSMAIVYGYFDGNDTSKSTWTTLSCKQRVQQVITSLTVSSPDMIIQTNPPPVLDYSTAKYLYSSSSSSKSNTSIDDATFGWWHSELDDSYVMFNRSALDPILFQDDESAVSNGAKYFSSFFRGAFFGRTPLPLETIRRNDTESRALILKHLQLFYGRYMAQYMSSNLRVNTTASTATPDEKANDTSMLLQKRSDGDNIVELPSLITGFLTPNRGIPRLVQHRTPKIIMQVMLIIMFLCGCSALVLGRYHDLTVWNPCTVAGSMVLFAGSRMCESPSGKEKRFEPDDSGTRSMAKGGDLNAFEMQDIAESKTRTTTAWQRKSQRRSGYQFMETPKSIGSGEFGNASGQDWEERYRHSTFRLGWWKDGVYIGAKKETDWNGHGEDGEDWGDRGEGRWRYGIDVVTT